MSTAVSDTPTPQEMTSTVTPVVVPTSSSVMHGNRNNITHMAIKESDIIVPDFHPEIKHEPPEDIDDIPHISNTSMNYRKLDNDKFNGPKIRLTPTIKLMPTSNPLDPKRKFACPYENCTKSYGKSSHLRSHLTWHTGIKPFVCSVLNCGKGFTRSDELNRHVRTHTGEKPFECVQCTKKFSRSDHLTKHLATHAKQMQNSSNSSKRPRSHGDVCRTRRSVYSDDSSDTKPRSKEVKSPTDHMHYNDGMHFMAALVESCAQAETVRPHETESNSIPENLTDDGMLDHRPIKIKLERPENSDEYHVVSPTASTTTPLERIDVSESGGGIACASETDNKSILLCAESTQNKSLPGKNITPEEKCPTVTDDGAFMGWPELGKITAEVAYDPDRPWRCKLCKKSFKRQDDLNRHLRTHTGDKPFACSECERRFMRSDHLKKHLKTHTKLR